jgi:hypothetical protein
VRRITEQAGERLLRIENEEVMRIEKETPPSVAGPKLQLISVDGAMVPLINKEWTEVKTLAIGIVQDAKLEKGKKVVHTTELSYFSRCAEASEFCRQSLYEVHRRGTEKAGKVCALTDGAEWEQGFMDYHRPDAVRILDFAHVAEKIASVGRAIYGEGSERFGQWFGNQREVLKSGRPAEVLSGLRKLRNRAKRMDSAEKLQVVEEALTYLNKRRSMIEYADFQRRGYPIGSGTVESANKVVVQSRMKQAGMHWARANINPMLVLRNVACNDRWDEAWTELVECRQEAVAERFRQYRDRNSPAPSTANKLARSTINLIPKVAQEIVHHQENSGEISVAKRPYRPAANHPWRKMRYGRGRNLSSSAKS